MSAACRAVTSCWVGDAERRRIRAVDSDVLIGSSLRVESHLTRCDTLSQADCDDTAMTHFVDREDYDQRTERLITGIAWEVPVVDLRDDRWVIGRWTGRSHLAVVPRGGLLGRF